MTSFLYITFLLILNHSCIGFPIPKTHQISQNRYNTNTNLHAASSLRPLAEPLMDSGKALARSGELLIEFTSSINEYGGGISSAGASMRNCGDYLAQAAASSRFKTAAELVSSEMREAADCLLEASSKMEGALEELAVSVSDDDNANSSSSSIYIPSVQGTILPLKTCGQALEDAGAAILQGLTAVEVGQKLEDGVVHMQEVSVRIGDMARLAGDKEGGALLSSQRLAFAATKLKEAGNRLTGTTVDQPKGKGWLKGGGVQ